MTIRLTTLGALELSRAGVPALVRRRKELALLAYLARRSPRPVPRAGLATMLWSDVDETRSRRSLRQALSDLREVLGESLVADQEVVRIATAVVLDVAEFEADVGSGRWTEATARWHGPFLDGLEDLGDERWRGWIEAERAQLRTRLAACYRNLVADAVAADEREAAIRWASQWSDQFPHDEEAVGRLIETLLAARRGAEARARHAEFAERLRQDLGTEPDPKLASLLDASATPIGRPGIRGLLSPDLVGRRDLLARLHELWKSVADGEGRVVVITGDEGLGKTRLIGEFLSKRRSGDRKTVIVSARGHSRESSEPLLEELITSLVNAPGASAVAPEALATLATVTPAVKERFRALPPAESNARVESAWIRLVTEVAADQSVILTIDDAPLADRISEGALAALVRRPPPGCLVLLAGRREHWNYSPLGEALSSIEVERISLQPFSRAETEALIGSMAPFAPAAIAELADAAFKQAGGVPGQVVQLVHSLAEHGAIAPTAGGTWEVTQPIEPWAVPSGVRDVMEERLRQLSPSARSLVEAAAVIGPRVEPEVLEAVSGLSAAEFQAALGIAFGRRLLRDDPSTRGLAFGSEANRLAVSNLLAPTARQAIHRAAAKALADRGAPGSIVAEHRRQGGVDPARRVRVRLAVAGAALLVTAVVGWVGYRRATAAVVQPGTGILLADVRNQTADSGLGRAIYSAALVALQESPRVWILGRNQFPEILTRMRRVDTIVDGNLAREVAVRENLAVVAQVELAAIDSSFLITGRLIDAESGRDLEAANVRVAGRSGILPGVERLTATLRRSLGDVTRSTRRGDSLPRISTSSLAALVAFAEGDRAWIRGEWIRARDSWVRAVELDSAFALAYVSLAAFSFRMANAPADGRRYLALAERFADRLTERERLRLDLEIATREGHAERAVAIARTIAERYPTPGTLFGLGTTLLRNGRCPEATPVFERAVAMSPRFSNAWINLATCHNALGDLEPALAAYREAERADSTALIRDNINHEWGQVFLKAGRPTAAESAFQKILGHPEANQRARGYRSLGYLAMYQGRYREAAAALEQAIGLSRAAGVHVSLVRNLTIIANALISSGDVARAAERLDEGRRILAAQEFEAFYLESLGAGYLRLGRPGPAAELLLALGKQVRPTSLLDSAMYRRLAARIAVSRGRYREALGLLATAPPPSAPPTAAWDYLRGEAYLGLNLPDSALAAFQAARAIWNWGFEGQEEWVRASFRIGVVAEQLGNHDLARTAYSELIDRWQQGDSTIRELRAARQRLASLQTTPR